jgi:hypothetical protein
MATYSIYHDSFRQWLLESTDQCFNIQEGHAALVVVHSSGPSRISFRVTYRSPGGYIPFIERYTQLS